jgi:hypothetical protein
MPRYLCEYCDVYLGTNTEKGRRQHVIGKKHQEQVRMYYTNFLRTHKQVGDPAGCTFIAIPGAKQALQQQVEHGILSKIQPNIIPSMRPAYGPGSNENNNSSNQSTSSYNYPRNTPHHLPFKAAVTLPTEYSNRVNSVLNKIAAPRIARATPSSNIPLNNPYYPPSPYNPSVAPAPYYQQRPPYNPSQQPATTNLPTSGYYNPNYPPGGNYPERGNGAVRGVNHNYSQPQYSQSHPYARPPYNPQQQPNQYNYADNPPPAASAMQSQPPAQLQQQQYFPRQPPPQQYVPPNQQQSSTAPPRASRFAGLASAPKVTLPQP